MTAPSSTARASHTAPRARPSARWVRPQLPDELAVATLAAELRLPIPICRLLCQRGYGDVEPAKRYLRPRLDQLHDPLLLLDLDNAVERLVRAIRSRELIMIHGDYDVDGMCSTTLLLRAITRFGGRAVPFIPRRLEDGYDLSMAGVNAAIGAGAKVLVTCDCGTNALAPVAAARAAGIDVIISDHHLPGGPLPECVAVLNPKRPGCEYPDKDLAAVGVAFKIALALAKALGESEEPVLRMLDLVALATIADIAPLRGENRVMARYGLRRLAASPIPGLRALIRAAGIEGKPLTAGRVGFILAPRLNAVGRLGHALRGVQLLMTEDEHEANSIARELEELNRRRQELDRTTLRDASRMVDALDLDSTYGIVLGGEGWHPGVIGIVASRLVEEVCRPVVMVALDGETGKGSGRSISGFDLHSALTECSDLLIRFGGHRAAAGVTVAADRMTEFQARFNEVARARLTPDDLVPEVKVDLDIALSEATPDLEALLRHFEPFGVGNATPVLAATGVRLAGQPRVLRNGHLRLRIAADGVELDAIGWGMGHIAQHLSTSAPVDVAFRLERDEWNGESRLQARLADVRESH
ncbi:MAG TPA: single-stranded-DNA-specific exonuclease RecJ [Gemmatimonadaceae bacterium]|nr:single-stranded-DNA-specific exonuclease RecJ [Gemmatimonadaceae bacterium]